jgi:hypothetical protein
MQFCSAACFAAYQQRLSQHTKQKILQLDIIQSREAGA